MAGALRKTMLYLGLAEDAETPDAYGEHYQNEAPMPAPTEYSAPVTPLHRGSDRASLAAVPAANELRRITTIHPRSYNDARLIGEAFRGGTPVIMNLSDMDDADAKRLVDFSAGLIFGLHGAIERVTAKVFLLSPEHIEILGEEDVEPPAPSGHFYNQS